MILTYRNDSTEWQTILNSKEIKGIRTSCNISVGRLVFEAWYLDDWYYISKETYFELKTLLYAE